MSLEDQLKIIRTTKRVKASSPDSALTSIQSSMGSRVFETPVLHKSIQSIMSNNTEPFESKWELVFEDSSHPSQLNIYL